MSSLEGVLLPACPPGYLDVVFLSEKHKGMSRELVDQTENFQKAIKLQQELDRIENLVRIERGRMNMTSTTHTVDFSSSGRSFVAYTKMLLDHCANTGIHHSHYQESFFDSAVAEDDPITKKQKTIMKQRDELLQEFVDTPCFVRVLESDFAEENA